MRVGRPIPTQHCGSPPKAVILTARRSALPAPFFPKQGDSTAPQWHAAGVYEVPRAEKGVYRRVPARLAFSASARKELFAH